MKNFRPFLITGLSIYAITVTVFTILFVSGTLSHDLLPTIIPAVLLPFADFLGGMFMLRTALPREQAMFYILSLGGMVARMFLLLAAIIIMIKFLNITVDYFIIIIFTLYFLGLTVKIAFLTKAESNNVR